MVRLPDLPRLAGAIPTIHSFMSSRFFTGIGLAAAMALAGWLLWSGIRPDVSPPPDAASRPWPVIAAAENPSSPLGDESAVAGEIAKVAPVETTESREILARGLARQVENAKIREDLAAGWPAPLPEALKVADLPLDIPPPRPVSTPKDQ